MPMRSAMVGNSGGGLEVPRFDAGVSSAVAPATATSDLGELGSYLEAHGMPSFPRDSFLWVQKRTGFLDSYPPHRQARLRLRDAIEFFSRGIAVVRYTCEEGRGDRSFEYLWDDKGFTLDSVHKSSRRNIRRNLSACVVQRVDFELLAREGCAINRSVFARHGRRMDSVLTNELKWRRYARACQAFSSLEAYGVFVHGRLCAFSLAHLVDDYCYLVHPHAFTDYLNRCPIHVLMYTIVKTMLERPSVRCVSAGLEPFSPRPTLERFKLSMGCRKAPVYRRVSLNPMARPMFSQIGSPLVTSVLTRVKPQLLDDYSIFLEYLKREHAATADSPASADLGTTKRRKNASAFNMTDAEHREDQL